MTDYLTGRFLIASPHLPDSNFSRTVVFMVEHHEEGALGLILNKPTNAKLADIWKYVDGTPLQDMTTEVSKCLRLGGPVEGHIMCLHSHSFSGDTEVIDGVYLATDPEQIRDIIGFDDVFSHVYWGYAGWGAGQLERELKVGGWLTGDASAALVFDDDAGTFWNRVVSRNGREILRDALRISNFPEDPQLN